MDKSSRIAIRARVEARRSSGTASPFGESPRFEEEDVGGWVIGGLESLGRKGRLALWTGCRETRKPTFGCRERVLSRSPSPERHGGRSLQRAGATGQLAARA